MNRNGVIADALTHMELILTRLKQGGATSDERGPSDPSSASLRDRADAIRLFETLAGQVRAELALPRHLGSEMNRRVRGQLLMLERDLEALHRDPRDADPSARNS